MARLTDRIKDLFARVATAGSADARNGEAVARKARSIALLKAEMVPYIEHLPHIASERETVRRSIEEIAHRAIALAIVAAKGQTNDYQMGRMLIEKFGASQFLSPNESEFMSEREPAFPERAENSWHIEGAQVMLWALAIIPTLPRPDAACEARNIVETLNRLETTGIVAQGQLRPQSEILDAADLIYRYHWAVRDAGLKGSEPPAGLMPGVVFERHRALNWLIGYNRQPWDDVTTDT